MPHARPVDRLARPAPQAARGAGDRASVTLALFESTLRLASLSWSASTVSLMGRTPKRWISMNALVPREVDRTFSAVGRYLTGLPGKEPHEPGRQDFPNLGKALV
jgi:hypothetical protein